jgi:hypothetical protein
MLEVMVRFDASAERDPVVVTLPNHTRLTNLAARFARAIEAPAANVTVSDGCVAYRVTDSGARRVKLDE